MNRASWKTVGRDKVTCTECLEEKRRFLEDVKYKDLPEQERKLKTYVEMGAFFCTGCIRYHIANNLPFVYATPDGSMMATICAVK